MNMKQDLCNFHSLVAYHDFHRGETCALVYRFLNEIQNFQVCAHIIHK